MRKYAVLKTVPHYVNRFKLRTVDDKLSALCLPHCAMSAGHVIEEEKKMSVGVYASMPLQESGDLGFHIMGISPKYMQF